MRPTTPATRTAPTAPTTTPHLAVLLPHLRQGGGESSMLRLAAGLARDGLHVTLLVYTLAGAELVVPPSLRVVELGSTGTLASLFKLTAWLRASRPHGLLSAFPHTNVAAVAAAALAARWGAPCTVVVSEHAPLSVQIQRHSHEPGAWRWRALPSLVRWAYRRAGAVVAVSEGVRADLLQMVGAGAPLHTIHNPVLDAADAGARAAKGSKGALGAPGAMGASDTARATPLHPWLLDPTLRVVLSVSRLSEEKDIPTLLRAFATLHRQRPQTRLLLVGDGPVRVQLQAQIVALQLHDVVALPGRVTAPAAWMRAAAVLALASTYEGFGNVLVEALAEGTRVVSTDCPVGPREILAGGRYGGLVPVGDDKAMAQALKEAVDQPGANAEAVAWAWRYTDTAACAAYRRLLDCLWTRTSPSAHAARLGA